MPVYRNISGRTLMFDAAAPSTAQKGSWPQSVILPDAEFDGGMHLMKHVNAGLIEVVDKAGVDYGFEVQGRVLISGTGPTDPNRRVERKIYHTPGFLPLDTHYTDGKTEFVVEVWVSGPTFEDGTGDISFQNFYMRREFK